MRRLSTRSTHDLLMDEEEDYRRFLDEQAQTIRFFEGLAKPLSTREIEILAEDEWNQSFQRAEEACRQFNDAFVQAMGEHTDRMMMDEKRTCAECRYFDVGRFSSYCYEFHRPREVTPGTLACEWFGGRR